MSGFKPLKHLNSNNLFLCDVMVFGHGTGAQMSTPSLLVHNECFFIYLVILVNCIKPLNGFLDLEALALNTMKVFMTYGVMELILQVQSGLEHYLHV